MSNNVHQLRPNQGRQRAALARFFEKTKPAVLGFLVRRLGDKDLAEDNCQEAFLRFTKGAYDPEAENAQAVLFGIATNLFRDHLRKLKRMRESGFLFENGVAPEDLEAVSSELPLPDQIHTDREKLQRVLDEVRRLPPRCRDVFVLHRVHGLSHKEISDRLGISISMVEKHMTRAIGQLMALPDD